MTCYALEVFQLKMETSTSGHWSCGKKVSSRGQAPENSGQVQSHCALEHSWERGLGVKLERFVLSNAFTWPSVTLNTCYMQDTVQGYLKVLVFSQLCQKTTYIPASGPWLLLFPLPGMVFAETLTWHVVYLFVVFLLALKCKLPKNGIEFTSYPQLLKQCLKHSRSSVNVPLTNEQGAYNEVKMERWRERRDVHPGQKWPVINVCSVTYRKDHRF